MVPMEMYQRAWTWLCVYPINGNSNTWLKFARIFFTTFTYVAHLSLVAASIAFIIHFASIDLEGCLHSLFHITDHTGLLYALVVGLVLRHKIVVIFEKLQEIHNKSKNRQINTFIN